MTVTNFVFVKRNSFKTTSTLRVSYKPEWSPSRPYITYRNGTAGMSYETLRQAAQGLGADHRAIDEILAKAALANRDGNVTRVEVQL